MSLRSRSGFARPYIAALSCLMRLTVPSTAPELYSRVRPATTASRSRRKPDGERAQRRQVRVDSTHPPGEGVLVAGQILDHPGEPGHTVNCRVDLGTAGADRAKSFTIDWVETPRKTGNPPGDLPHRRPARERPQRRDRGRLDVA